MSKKEVKHLRYPVVWVAWEDSVHVRGEVYEGELDTTFKSPVNESVGHLVEERTDYLTIAQEWGVGNKAWRFLMRIPRSAIKETIRLVEA